MSEKRYHDPECPRNHSWNSKCTCWPDDPGTPLTIFRCPSHECDNNGPEVALPNGGSVSCSKCGSLSIDRDMMEPKP
jgi:hypothetical protein